MSSLVGLTPKEVCHCSYQVLRDVEGCWEASCLTHTDLSILEQSRNKEIECSAFPLNCSVGGVLNDFPANYSIPDIPVMSLVAGDNSAKLVVPAANYSILPKWQFLHVSASWTSWSSVKMIPRVCESDLLRSATLSMRRILAVFGWVKCLGTCKGVRRYLMGYLLSCSMHMLCVEGFRARFGD